MRIGVVGLGFGQRVHIPAWKNTPHCEVVALCSAHPEKAARVAAEQGIGGAYSSVDEMLEESRLDILSIAVPPTEQPAILHAAARKGVNVFFEKPLGANLASATEAAIALQRANVLTGADFIFPELSTWITARDHMNAGMIGSPTHAAISWRLETYAARNAPNSWKLSGSAGGGALNSFASHSFYYLEWLYGRIVSIDARLKAGTGADTQVECSMSFVGGLSATLSISTDTVGVREHRVQLFGTEGILELKNISQDYVNGFELMHSSRDSKGAQLMTEPVEFEDGRTAPVRSLIARFASSVATRAQITPGVDEALRVQRVMDSARQSSERRCDVAVPQ